MGLFSDTREFHIYYVYMYDKIFFYIDKKITW
jgi:hypothetical protein